MVLALAPKPNHCEFFRVEPVKYLPMTKHICRNWLPQKNILAADATARINDMVAKIKAKELEAMQAANIASGDLDRRQD